MSVSTAQRGVARTLENLKDLIIFCKHILTPNTHTHTPLLIQLTPLR